MTEDADDDVKAISTVISVLKPLDTEVRVHVLEYVLKRLNISLNTNIKPLLPDNSLDEAIPERRASVITSRIHEHIDIRSFANEKKPKTVNEKVAVLGYFLTYLAPELERKETLVSDDIKTYFIQAGFQLPTAPANMTLIHAKNAGYFNSAGSGQYKLNAVGYNLVAHKLPLGSEPDKKQRLAKKPVKKSAVAKSAPTKKVKARK